MARDLGSAADMFVGLDHCVGPAVMLDLGSAADVFVGRGGPAVTLDLGGAADMVVGLDPRGGPTAPRWRATSAARRTCSSASRVGPAAMLDLSGAADMFVGLEVGSPDMFANPAARSPSARERGVLEMRT